VLFDLGEPSNLGEATAVGAGGQDLFEFVARVDLESERYQAMIDLAAKLLRQFQRSHGAGVAGIGSVVCEWCAAVPG
jgi:hypothetical protein